eukprot:3943608-Lingulodinium_polyedra.AAC.1
MELEEGLWQALRALQDLADLRCLLNPPWGLQEFRQALRPPRVQASFEAPQDLEPPWGLQEFSQASKHQGQVCQHR